MRVYGSLPVLVWNRWSHLSGSMWYGRWVHEDDNMRCIRQTWRTSAVTSSGMWHLRRPLLLLEADSSVRIPFLSISSPGYHSSHSHSFWGFRVPKLGVEIWCFLEDWWNSSHSRYRRQVPYTAYIANPQNRHLQNHFGHLVQEWWGTQMLNLWLLPVRVIRPDSYAGCASRAGVDPTRHLGIPSPALHQHSQSTTHLTIQASRPNTTREAPACRGSTLDRLFRKSARATTVNMQKWYRLANSSTAH